MPFYWWSFPFWLCPIHNTSPAHHIILAMIIVIKFDEDYNI
jgi:hypothetical protein